jgi:hypothetical protein
VFHLKEPSAIVYQPPSETYQYISSGQGCQYRCLRIALGLMQSTHFQTLEVIGGVPPLRLRFSMLNHKYLVSACSTGGHPLRRLFAMLSRLNSTKMVREFDMVGDYDLEPVHLVYDNALEALLDVPNVNDVVKQELTSVSSRLVALATSGFDSSSIFFTDGSKGGRVPVLVYIILVVSSAAFVLGNQVECLLRRCR